jgi:1-acyl-sn-glycerol-3-phosphate acyltransferase
MSIGFATAVVWFNIRRVTIAARYSVQYCGVVHLEASGAATLIAKKVSSLCLFLLLIMFPAFIRQEIND